MSEIIKLVPRHARASKAVADRLTELAEIAERDGITQVAIAATDREGYTHTTYHVADNRSRLIGATEYLRHRLVSGFDD